MVATVATKSGTMTNDDVEESLRDIPGFTEGRQRRESILLLGEKIRQLRESELGISQTQAAKLIGMEQPELSRIENGVGKRGPSYLTITRIINAYQSYLRKHKPAVHVGLSIDVSYEDTQQAAQFLLTDS